MSDFDKEHVWFCFTSWNISALGMHKNWISIQFHFISSKNWDILNKHCNNPQTSVNYLKVYETTGWRKETELHQMVTHKDRTSYNLCNCVISSVNWTSFPGNVFFSCFFCFFFFLKNSSSLSCSLEQMHWTESNTGALLWRELCTECLTALKPKFHGRNLT